MTGRRLFGTDGIRGRADHPPLDEDTVRRLGVSLARCLGGRHTAPELLLAGDTRESTERLAGWFAEAFQASGGRVTWGGVLPTPAVSQLLRDGGWAAGLVISASHNPAHDNGLKVLGAGGEKLSDALELELEQELECSQPLAGPELPTADGDLAGRYRDHVAASLGDRRPLSGLTIAVDAANGAASGLAESLLERLGAHAVPVASWPDGTNINLGVGATAPETLAARVRAIGADAGLALDGDADRAILVTGTGRVLDGDDILLIWARQLAAADRLDGRVVVATVMSNLGLERALEQEAIRCERCPVGDRAVWETMRQTGATLGGEQSGHVICSHFGVTGDGLLTGSQVLAAAAESGRTLDELATLERLPQILVNVPVTERRPFDEVPDVVAAIHHVEDRLRGRGRLLLRFSGTEPLVRVMIEGDDQDEIAGLANGLAETIRRRY